MSSLVLQCSTCGSGVLKSTGKWAAYCADCGFLNFDFQTDRQQHSNYMLYMRRIMKVIVECLEIEKLDPCTQLTRMTEYLMPGAYTNFTDKYSDRESLCQDCGELAPLLSGTDQCEPCFEKQYTFRELPQDVLGLIDKVLDEPEKE